MKFLIIAAGASTRMGTPKQLLLYQGLSFLQYITLISSEMTSQHILCFLNIA
ncbi:MAG: NTP transferase domain-containing protein [Nostoc sp.]|uniref:NTP transferase domain-containing protein n=1 Tax=Nostoc sp. TaxID=1180 RepID=UPI002FF1DD61